MTEAKFNAFIEAIADPVLRNRITDSALTNAFEFAAEYPNDEKRWEVALATAEECLDCAHDYYPELFVKAAP